MWEKGRGHCFWSREEREVGESAGLRRNRKKMGVRRKSEFGGLFFSFPASFPRLFLCSTSLLPLLPASSAPLLPASRGNGRLLGKRSKRRNCLRVQSSKKASSIWRDRVRRARRPLPCPPAAAAAAAPASCRGDPEPGPPVSAAARTRTRTLTLTLTHTRPPQPHAPSLPGRHLLGPGSFVAPAAARLPFGVSPGVTGRVVCPCGAGLCGSLRAHHAGPRAPARPAREPAAPEVSHVAEVCFLFIKSCVYLLVWGGGAAAGRAMPGKRRRVAGGPRGRSGAERSGRAGRGAQSGDAAGSRPPGAPHLPAYRRGPARFPEASRGEEGPGQPPRLAPEG